MQYGRSSRREFQRGPGEKESTYTADFIRLAQVPENAITKPIKQTPLPLLG